MSGIRPNTILIDLPATHYPPIDTEYRRPGHLSPSWLASLRFTSVDKHPGAPDRTAAAGGARIGVFVDEA